MDLQRFSSLIEAMYDAALDPQGWSRLAPSLARAFGAESCSLQTRDLAKGTTSVLALTANYDAKAQAKYEAYYHSKDLWVAGAAKAAVGEPLIGTEIVSEAALLASEMYNDYSKRQGIFQIVGGMMAVEQGTVGVIGIHRPRNAPAFEGADKRHLQLLLPHLTRAMQVHVRFEGLRRVRGLALEAVDALAVGLMAVDADGRLLFANTRAERLLRKRRELMVSHGYLRARQRAQDDQLARLVRQAALAAIGASKGSGGVLALPREDGSALSLLVSPLRPGAMAVGTAQPLALIFIGDPDDQARPAPTVLADLYGLTPAEARLTAALLAGEQLNAYAEQSGISRETARTLLKRVFAKTGCGRQGELIAALLANPVLRAAVAASSSGAQQDNLKCREKRHNRWR
jgi:DNA-binding CsgD family transcriptional regulator/PAS domain-containing protein